MLIAADLCFLYLRVSQNTALYRDTEKRLQQKSSRTESFVFVAHLEDRTDSLVLCDTWFHRGPTQANATEFYYLERTINRNNREHQSSSRPSEFCNDEASQAAGPAYSSKEHLSCNMWPVSQHGWDWLLFTEECLCSSAA